jgi:hypothetical protein
VSAHSRPSPRAIARRAATRLAPPLRRLVNERDALRREVERLRRDERVYGDYEYVFVVTYGRSGSTLLQAVLNSTPGVLIRGENRALAYHLHKFHDTAVNEAARVGNAARRRMNPFFGIRDYPAELALTRARELLLDTVLRPEAGTRVLGFKEIRWYQDDLPAYLDFMRQVFPGARFVVNTRRLEDVARSSWWSQDEHALEKLVEIEQRMLAATDALGSAAYRVRYDDYVDDPGMLRGLFDWLGLPFDENRVRAVFSTRYADIP